MFHMGWFLGKGFGVYGWNGQWSGNVAKDVARPDLFVDMAKGLERAGFDYLMLEDSSVLPDVYGSSFDYALKVATVRHDPMPLVPLLAAQTRHLGIVSTAATTFYPPFLAARLFRTLDHLTEGRVGINLVTASPHAAAQNYGLAQHVEHDARYAMAAEWTRAVKALWDTWDADALVLDERAGIFADPSKVHYANFEGEHYRTRGPLNTVPSPQQHPVICQAGGSPAGRELAAEHADTIIAIGAGLDGMKEYRDDISARVLKYGRKPADVKVLFLVDPVLGDTDEDAAARRDRRNAAQAADLEAVLSGMSYLSGFDFAKFDLDAPFPDIEGKSNGHQSMVDAMARAGRGRTLREVASTRRNAESVELVGTPDTVAAQMGEVMEHVGGDGFLINGLVTRKNITEICDGLAPALRRRGLIRSGYPFETFRENLLEF
ncbi:FMNH2-dependent monooxygenase [Pseudonocardia sp. CNS-139]|nr:FMNH2-dependent monooxygenase [Pseudonocardia sp. CNS-139]